jgi:hypothetical protein
MACIDNPGLKQQKLAKQHRYASRRDARCATRDRHPMMKPQQFWFTLLTGHIFAGAASDGALPSL